MTTLSVSPSSKVAVPVILGVVVPFEMVSITGAVCGVVESTRTRESYGGENLEEFSGKTLVPPIIIN